MAVASGAGMASLAIRVTRALIGPYRVKGKDSTLTTASWPTVDKANVPVLHIGLDLDLGVARHDAHDLLTSGDHLADAGDDQGLDPPGDRSAQGQCSTAASDLATRCRASSARRSASPSFWASSDRKDCRPPFRPRAQTRASAVRRGKLLFLLGELRSAILQRLGRVDQRGLACRPSIRRASRMSTRS